MASLRLPGNQNTTYTWLLWLASFSRFSGGADAQNLLTCNRSVLTRPMLSYLAYLGANVFPVQMMC